jgi:hypothetical protein
MNDTPPGWVRDPGLDAESVASMTPNEAKEYLTLVIRYFPPWQLPSLAWLRGASAVSHKRDSQSPSESRGGYLVPYTLQSSSGVNSASMRQRLLNLLRHAPVTFDTPAKRSQRQAGRPPRKGPRRSGQR